MLSGDRKIAPGLKSMDTMLAYRGACGRSSIAARQGLAILSSKSFTDPLRLVAECEIGVEVVWQKLQTSAGCCDLLDEYAARIERWVGSRSF
jgi:hypothetical protein